jgi:hypothetical protein
VPENQKPKIFKIKDINEWYNISLHSVTGKSQAGPEHVPKLLIIIKENHVWVLC